MPLTYTFDASSRRFTLVVDGTVTTTEFRDFMTTAADSSDFDVDAVWDLRRMDFGDVDADFWRQIIQIRRQYPERSRGRIVYVVEGDFEYGMMRMYQILSELDGFDAKQKRVIFRSMEEADDWLAAPRG